MAKYKLHGSIYINNDIVELDDNMTDEEIEQELSEYVNDRLDGGYERIDEDETIYGGY